MHDECRSLTLGELAELRAEKLSGRKPANLPYVGLEHIAQGEPLLLGTAASDSSVSTNSVFHRGDILFGKLRPNLRKILQICFDGCCSTDLLVLRPHKGFSANFVSRVFQSDRVFEAAVRTAEGTKMPRTSWERLKPVRIPIPPFPEQRRIVEILDTVDAAIQETEALIAKLNLMRAGLLHDFLTRGINSYGKLRGTSSSDVEFKTTIIGRIPKSWRLGRLSEFYATDSRTGLYKPAQYYGSGPLMIHMPQLFRGLVVNVSDAPRVNVSRRELERFGLRQGDLVFARRSLTVEGAGQCSLVPRLPEATTFESSVIRVRLDSGKLRPEFANLFLSSEAGFRLRMRQVRQVAVSGVSGEDIAELPVPCPPTSEQDAIVALSLASASRISAEEKTTEKLRLIKHGLMRDLLSASVRVCKSQEAGE